ncbi:predicted protein [Naegleria gruberi]|uniref:Predicted protein n=1 Tax=Naegleria gruberi TaxID=5762 RepID=D2VFT6_NAEGR|nr:uncharacterized protein NAEGRDRAFT_67738 [Naegleria gruberi]EFC44136.1 predicted protein [Naegleria gruberi]|eukprot:XP_002676880.1 predicted protein [Naegleria gruberi strain NEG-M]
MSSCVVLIFNDLQSSPLLIGKFRQQQAHRLHTIRIVYCHPHHQVPQLLNTETIALMKGMDKEKPMSDRKVLNYPEEHKPMMKKLEKLCEKVGRLQAFRYHRYYECHIGGFEYEINAYGIGGVFFLVFYSEGDW